MFTIIIKRSNDKVIQRKGQSSGAVKGTILPSTTSLKGMHSEVLIPGFAQAAWARALANPSVNLVAASSINFSSVALKFSA